MSDILKQWRSGAGLPGVLVIDGHTHVGPWPHGANFDTIEEAERDVVTVMDTNGVDAACVLSGGFMPPGSDYTRGNDWLLDLTSRLPDRLVPFGHVNPNDNTDRMLAELKRLTGAGVRCLKLLNSYQERYPGDGPNLMEVYGYARDHHMLILNHSWSNEEIARIAPQYAEIDFILGHYNRSRDPVLRELPNVYASTWNLAEMGFLEAGIREVGPERFLFGSDAFMNPISVGVGMVVYADISDEDKRLVLGRNQARLLAKVDALPVKVKHRYRL